MSCTPSNHSIQRYTFFDFRKRAQSPLFPILASCYQQLKAVSLCTNDRRTHFSPHPVDNTEILTSPHRGATGHIAQPVTLAGIISIHAPTPGGDLPEGGGGHPQLISTHAPAPGATASRIYEAQQSEFQPTPPHRGRRIAPVSAAHGFTISTHAPAPGATTPRPGPATDRPYFNPRPRTGGDKRSFSSGSNVVISTHAPAPGATAGIYNPGANMLFQPTPPHRGRPFALLYEVNGDQFQPTPPHRGRRGDRRSRPQRPGISTHAPAPGATFFGGELLLMCLFQPTPPHRGRRRVPGCPAELRAISTHAPAPGATSVTSKSVDFPQFQPTPPHRGRHSAITDTPVS